MAINLNPDQSPGGNASEVFPLADAHSGVAEPGIDPTNQLGQTPPSLFGAAQSYETGAPGSQGAVYSPAVDPTNEPGQVDEGLSGTTSAENADTGAPGSAGAQNHGPGPDAVKFTRPGSYLTGTNIQDTVGDSVAGTDDWTQAIDGSYGGNVPFLPGIKGNTPTTTGAGAGRVLRGGRAVRP